MDNHQMPSSSGSPPCVQLDSLKSELMKHIEAFEVLSGLNSDLKPEILIKNLKKVLENVGNPKDLTNKNSSRRTKFNENENPNKNPPRTTTNSTTASKITASTSTRKGRQNKEKLNVEKEQVGKVIDNNRKNGNNKMTNEIYWGDFEKRRSVRRKSSTASTSKYDNNYEGGIEIDDSDMYDQQDIVQNNTLEEEDVKVNMNTTINTSNLTSEDESLELNKSNESIEKKLLTADEGIPSFVYECTICNKQLTYEWNARRHVKQVHFKERFFCPNSKFGCDRAFYNQTRLKYHVPICNARQMSKNKNRLKIPNSNLFLNNPYKNFKLQRALNARVLVRPLVFANNQASTATNLENQEFPPIPKLTKQSEHFENPNVMLIKRDNNSPPPILIPSADYSPTVVTFDFVRQDVFRSPPRSSSTATTNKTSEAHEANNSNNWDNHNPVDSKEILNYLDLKRKVPLAYVTENGEINESENEEEEDEEDEQIDDEQEGEENEQNLNEADIKQGNGAVINTNPNFVQPPHNDNEKETEEVTMTSNETDSSFNEDDEDMENNSIEDSGDDPLTLNCDLEIDAIEKPQSVKSSQNKFVVQSSVPLTQCQDTSKL